jgi:hypothetical protein
MENTFISYPYHFPGVAMTQIQLLVCHSRMVAAFDVCFRHTMHTNSLSIPTTATSCGPISWRVVFEHVLFGGIHTYHRIILWLKANHCVYFCVCWLHSHYRYHICWSPLNPNFNGIFYRYCIFTDTICWSPRGDDANHERHCGLDGCEWSLRVRDPQSPLDDKARCVETGQVALQEFWTCR